MKYKLKKTIIKSCTVLILSLTVILTGQIIQVSAANTIEVTEDLFEYIIKSDDDGNGYAEILGYGGNAQEVTVPSEIEGVFVTKIAPRAFRDNPDIVKLLLPESVESLGEDCFEDLENLEEITMCGVRKFSNKFGMETEMAPEYLFRYSKKLKRVIFGDGCHFFEEADGTGATNMFSNEVLNHLEYIYIGNQMPELPERVFCGTSLKEIEVGPQNAYYQSIDGVLFDKSKKSLMIMPTSYEKDTFVIPYGTTGIQGFGMDGCKGLKKIYIPQTMSGLTRRGFSGVSAVLYVVQGSDGERFAKEENFQYQYFGVHLDKTALNLEPGSSTVLQAFNETENSLHWNSSAPAVAAVDNNGTVTAKSVGTAEITVSDGAEFSVKCTVTVAEQTQTTEPDSTHEPDTDKPEHDKNDMDNPDKTQKEDSENKTNNSSGNSRNYKILNRSEVIFTGTENQNASRIVIPQTVTVNGKRYTVTQIADRAFYKNKKLSSVVIPSTIKKIGRQAFFGCKKLKSITMKTKKLTAKNVGKNAFKGIYAKADVKVPKSKLKTYKKLLKSKGAGSKIKYNK